MKFIVLILTILSCLFSYQSETIENSELTVFKDKLVEIYINRYDDPNKSEISGHIFYNGGTFYFDNIALDQGKCEFEAKNYKDDKNRSKVSLNLENDKLSISILNDKNSYNTDLTSSLKYPLLKFSGIYSLKALNFEFSKSLILTSKEDILNLENDLQLEYKESLSNYMEDAKDYINNEPSYIFYNTLNDKTNLFYQEGNLRVLSNYVDTYTGGAHPNHSYAYTVFLEDKKLSTDDILKKDTVNSLKSKLWLDVKEDSLIEKSDFYITSNFFLSPYGITFVYNPYEVTPYAVGTKELFYTYGEIYDFLSDDFKNVLKNLGIFG